MIKILLLIDAKYFKKDVFVHFRRTCLQRKPTNHLRCGLKRERCGEMRGGSSTDGRDFQMGVQQHDPQALRPAPHKQRDGEQRDLSTRHPRRLRHALLLGEQQHRSPADVMLLHSYSSG